MRRDWYETDQDPARTIYICCECYVPDPKAGKRTEALWERNEAIWGEVAYDSVESWVTENAWDNIIRALEDSVR